MEATIHWCDRPVVYGESARAISPDLADLAKRTVTYHH